jgi:drug/metabolite transporter (DMT)-like permease
MAAIAARRADPSSRPAEHRGRGIALRVGAVSAFGAMMAALKYASAHGTTPVEILFYRNLFALPTIIGWVLLSGGPAAVRTKRPAAHAARSGLGLGVMFCTFVALSMLPLAEATVISFSSPLFATALSALVLGEKVRGHRWSAIAVGFIGVLIVIQPGGAALPPIGIAIGLAAALGTAVVVISLRQIGETESATATVFWFNIACLVATSLPMPFYFHLHPQHVWAALVLGGLMGGAAQIMMTAAVRFAPVSVLAPFDYLQLVWATLWGYLLFATLPTWESLAGAALIAGAGCYVVWRERRIGKGRAGMSSQVLNAASSA